MHEVAKDIWGVNVCLIIKLWDVCEFFNNIKMPNELISVLDYPPNSPDLAPRDFPLFPKVKGVLKRI